MKLDKQYEEQVYAGVLGKIIGVYLGRPFEGWTYERIMEELGPINYYVNDKLKQPICVTDDDITGTFTFLRALRDFNYDKNITAKQIGQTWLNNLIEDRTILWWGGKGNSTEDTAYQNLKQGIHAPESGSIKRNGKTIAEQIGAQIFIDGWALVSPGNPEQAVKLAKEAGSVSHDGEAVYGAQVIAAIESLAFIEKDIKKIIEESKRFIPQDSTIHKLISDIQDWSGGNIDWEQAREKIAAKYGYDKYLGNCHMIPNHALIIMSLLFGDDDFQKTLMIVNTAGWDTDCNSGNVGCILGIKNGLEGIKTGPDYLSPINDTIYCPTAIGGETITDALTESYKIINTARNIEGLGNVEVKDNARYHFNLPGSTQSWKANHLDDNNPSTFISNVEYKSNIGDRVLEIEFKDLSTGLTSECYVDTFFPEELTKLEGLARSRFFHYDFISCPIIYSGQKIKTQLISNSNKDITVNIFIKFWGENDKLIKLNSENFFFKSNENKTLEWNVPDTYSNPIAQLGVSITSEEKCSGKLLVNYLDILGEPKITFKKPEHIANPKRGTEPLESAFYGHMWRNNWVQAIDKWESRWEEPFRITQNIGRGMIFTGNDKWKDYSVSSKLNFHLVNSGGIIARVQGLKRFYALEVTPEQKLRISKMYYEKETLKEIDFKFEFFTEYDLKLEVTDHNIKGYLDGKLIIEAEDKNNPLISGGAGIFVEDGTMCTNEITLN
jgi:ADP-ribosylglycohydrolase